MFSHVTLGTNDWAAVKPFWAAVMEALSIPVMFEYDGGIAYGEATGPKLFIGPPFDGQPGPRPHYHKNYYGAYMRDPDGNKIQAVCHRAEG
jgi:catechol 2,3-dioxygenase-like lactoylglutathione lyase family enzyme